MQVSYYISTMHQTGHAYYGIIGDGTGLPRSMPFVNGCCGFPLALPGPSQPCGWNALGNAKESEDRATMNIRLPRKAQDTATQRCSEAREKEGPQGAHGANL